MSMESPRGAIRSEINVTPLVDVCLVLLIIFMVVAPILHAGVKVELPKTVNAVSLRGESKQLTVTVAGFQSPISPPSSSRFTPPSRTAT